MPGIDAEQLIVDFLSKRGFTQENSLYTECVCPDEVNHDSSFEITNLLARRYNGVFPLGGAAGLPFTGQTGWGAFTSHCPKDGNIVVLIASHIGVNKQGEIGSITRAGQDKQTLCCEEAYSAYKAVKENPVNGQFLSGYMNHQMDTIKHLLVPHVNEIANADNEQIALAQKIYLI